MRQLVLLGGGHAHVHVLEALANAPIPDVAVTLITPYARQIYSGMLPGWIAGHYDIDACAIDLERLSARAGCPLRLTRAVELDPDAGIVECADGATVAFDWLSIDVGPVTATGRIDGAAEHALAVRPIEDFIGGIEHLQPLLADNPARPIAIIGAGAAGVELAFALRHRHPCAPITLIGSAPLPLDGLPTRLQRYTRRLFDRRRIDWCGDTRAQAITPDGVNLDNGDTVRASHVLQVTGAAAPEWPARAGLAVDAGGFIRVNACLQSVSHPNVFAAGDVAAYHAPRPKSGVFAVRAGPPLARNLRRALSGQALEPWAPQQRALYLISTGDHHAMGAWGPLSGWGDWMWRWKDRIDRAFMARFGA